MHCSGGRRWVDDTEPIVTIPSMGRTRLLTSSLTQDVEEPRGGQRSRGNFWGCPESRDAARGYWAGSRSTAIRRANPKSFGAKKVRIRGDVGLVLVHIRNGWPLRRIS